VARLVSPGLMQRLGAPIIVENRPGAAGSIGTDAVAKARPDGQTWLLTFDSHATMPALLPSLPFNLTRDLDPVMLIGDGGEGAAGCGFLRVHRQWHNRAFGHDPIPGPKRHAAYAYSLSQRRACGE
jgi:hypothetical protein